MRVPHLEARAASWESSASGKKCHGGDLFVVIAFDVLF